MTELNIKELRKVFDLIMDHIEEEHLSVEVDGEYYWSIPKEQLYNMSKEPAEFTVGQISDDWNEMQKMLTGDGEPISYGLVWLATLLRAVGEKVVA